MRIAYWIFLLGPLALAPAFAPAAIIHVPGDQPTIQAGINAAVDGDTVLVADGVYSGPGNRDLDFGGKAIIVRSANGPEGCTIDLNASFPSSEHRGFYFHSAEDSSAVVMGFTIWRGYVFSSGLIHGGGIYCSGASPTIVDCVIAGNNAELGGGIALLDSAASIYDCSIQGNLANSGGCGIYAQDSAPVIAGTVIKANGIGMNGVSGGGLRCFNSAVTVINCLFVQNSAYYGGGLYVQGGGVSISNSTITQNGVGMDGAGFYGGNASFVNCIIWHNGTDNIWDTGPLAITWSVAYDWWGDDWPGEGNINEDPLFVNGPLGGYYLSQITAGQGADSPCLDAGSAEAGTFSYPTLDGLVYLNQLTTRTDQAGDAGTVDMGYHHPVLTAGAGLSCTPASGTLPFVTQMQATLTNLHASEQRCLAGRIDVTLAQGTIFSGWRSGYTNVGPGGSFVTSWNQIFPARNPLVGNNVFTLFVEDVTPSPYNQPPYALSGDHDAWARTVQGLAP